MDSSYLDAYFETMSGFTTTGITMFTGLDNFPKSILLWRALIQWIGGLGILTFFLAVFSKSTGAHLLFGAESHKISSERPVPGLSNTVKILWYIYTGFTLLIIIMLYAAGSSLFDSICHSLTTLSTGGYSPYDASIGHYKLIGHSNYRLIEYILIFGMFLGGTNFLMHYRLIRRDFKSVFKSTEMKFWLSFIFGFTLLIFIERFVHFYLMKPINFLDLNFLKSVESGVRTTLFQVVSIITTTGFGTKDIGSPFFGYMAKQLFLIMMVIGGCVGSTGGGIKVLRIAILFKLIKREILRIFAPKSAVSHVIIDKNNLEPDEIYRVSSLFFIWIVFLVFGGLVTAFFSDLNSIQSFSGMFSALGNIGPSYIAVDKMTQLKPVIKIVYIFGMLAGRLEILPVLLLFSPKAWKY